MTPFHSSQAFWLGRSCWQYFCRGAMCSTGFHSCCECRTVSRRALGAPALPSWSVRRLPRGQGFSEGCAQGCSGVAASGRFGPHSANHCGSPSDPRNGCGTLAQGTGLAPVPGTFIFLSGAGVSGFIADYAPPSRPPVANGYLTVILQLLFTRGFCFATRYL